MRAVVQRVLDCRVEFQGRVTGEIDDGLLIYLGIEKDDVESDSAYLTEKIVNLRIFQDESGKMNLSAIDLQKEMLVVSQFTLFADARKGRRPSYSKAAEPETAIPLYKSFLQRLTSFGFSPKEGEFGGMMNVSYTNQGPVTILLDSKKLF